ncbi:MAG TPA: glycosyltransferase family 4 protein [Salinimicrobium sp.]|nr:glycosyltransferase family 4 protein [Salinimicrobium sp.]
MNKIKVLHILHAVGGVEVSVRLITENIDSEKIESVVLHGNKDTKISFFDDQKNPVRSYQAEISREINLIEDIKAIFQSFEIAKKEKPHLIHAHSAKGGIIGKIIGEFLSIPVLHTPQAYSYLSAESKWKKVAFLQIENFFRLFRNKILASSNSERNRAINDVGYKPQNALLFNNSIEPIETIQTLSIEKTWPDNYICSVGRPSFQKNIEMMVEVIHEIKKSKPEIHLVLMGVGFHSPNLDKVRRKIKEFHLQKNITLLDWTKREDIFYIIKNSMLYISTARYEGLPYSIIEALALKKACVVTDADGNRDLISNNKNGFVIFDQNVNEFADKILFLLDNETTRLKFEENAYKNFDANFNIYKTIRLLEEIYIENALPIKTGAKI